jgi:hypothetical protein
VKRIARSLIYERRRREAMKTERSRTELITSYLLGELSEEERSRLEEQYFADADLSHEVQAVRDDLVDAYVRGRLPGRERERFEKYFMASPRRRERVEFAAALVQSSAGLRATSRAGSTVAASGWRSYLASVFAGQRAVMAATALVLMAAGSWFVFKALIQPDGGSAPTGEQVASGPGDQAAPPTEPAGGEVRPGEVVTAGPTGPSPKPPPAVTPRPTPRREPRVAAFTLTPTHVRGDEGGRVVIPRGTDIVLLRFGLEGDRYESYRAQLRTPEGREAWSAAHVDVRNTASGLTASLRVPSKLLKDEDYVLRLSGVTAAGEVEEVAKFYFRAQRK